MFFFDFIFFFFFKQKTAYEISACLVGSEMCIRDRVSYVPQAKQGVFSYGVLEMVVMGLDKENRFFYTPKKDQFDRANEMLKELGVGKLADWYCNELSGGELQMVMLARAMAVSYTHLRAHETGRNLVCRLLLEKKKKKKKQRDKA